MIRFTLADLEAANVSWGCNCGPAALAAICGLTLEEVRRHFSSGWPGFTNVTTMYAALASACRASGRTWKPSTMNATPGSSAGKRWPRYGLARIQFEGPWTAPGANPRWAYRHTHWVGVSRLQRMDGTEDPSMVCVWDINAMGPRFDGWILRPIWESVIVPGLTADIKRATTGWHITHAIEVARP